jgi:hypothetical protein
LEELECAFGVVVGKTLMRKILWNLFGKTWIQNVGGIDFKTIFVTKNFKYIPKIQALEGKIG